MLLPLLIACSASDPIPPKRPDIVMVVVDTLRADHLGFAGHSRDTSPKMDALAKNGIWFSRAYAGSGWTLPSMATLMTGLHPHQHKAGRASFQGTRFGRLEPEHVTLAESLKGAGYASKAVVNNTFMAPDFELRQGFDVYDYLGATNKEHRSASVTVQTGLSWLKKQEKPAFLFLHVMEPHLNYEAIAPHLGRFSGENPAKESFDLEELVGKSHHHTPPSPEVQEFVRQRYDEEIRVVDDAMGELVDELKAADRWKNTVLIITSDHGEEFWEHGGFEHGHTLLGELTRIPLLLSGAVPAVGQVDTVVEHVDLVAGLYAKAGVASPAINPGTDLFALGVGAKVETPAVALSENILYGSPKVSVVNANARLEYDHESGKRTIWRVDPDGIERRREKGEAAQAHVKELDAALLKVRGNLMPLEIGDSLSIGDWDMFQQLKSLGYVDDDAAPVSE